jgi:hypothetical protein
MRPLALCFAAAASVLIAAADAAAQRSSPDPTIPDTVSNRIVADLARADLDAFAVDAAKYISPGASERLKNSFASIMNLGQSQYTELIYSRDYGETGKDIIHKINFDKAFAFVRLVWHIDTGNWHLVSLTYKTEGDLPLPKGWEHIYPK